MQVIAIPRVPDRHSTEREIQEYYASFGVDTTHWGKTGTKRSVASLIKYLREDNFTFVEGAQTPTVLVNVAVITVYHEGLILFEDRQVSKRTGAVQRRSSDFDGSVGETLHIGETSLDAALRGLREELRSHEGEQLFADRKKFAMREDCVEEWPPVPHDKFEGTQAIFYRHKFNCYIDPSIFREEGYTHEEDEREIFFQWRR